MDYLSQKIKSAPRIEVSPELHQRIMRRAFYEQIRFPFWILTGIAVVKLTADVWLILNHSFTKVVTGFADSFGFSLVGLLKISWGIIEKALLHPDLIATLVIDFLLFSYIIYLTSVFKGARKKFNADWHPATWLRYFGRAIRIAK